MRAPGAMNIRRDAIAMDFHCAIRNRSCIIHAITESMKRNKIGQIIAHVLHGMYTKRLICALHDAAQT